LTANDAGIVYQTELLGIGQLALACPDEGVRAYVDRGGLVAGRLGESLGHFYPRDVALALFQFDAGILSGRIPDDVFVSHGLRAMPADNSDRA
jgi:hypothetical protein